MTEPLRKPEEFDVNSQGGKQHSVPHRCQALFPRAILDVARLRQEGFEQHGYEDNNYLMIPAEDHVGRAIRHLLLWQAEDTEDGTRDEHLVHACCRVMMALEEIRKAEAAKRQRQESELEQLKLEYGYPED